MTEEEGEEFLEDVNIKINGEIARQERINKELEDSNENYKRGNIEGWKVNLDILYREIHSELEKEERETFKTLLNEVKDKYKKYCEQPQNQTQEIIISEITSEFCRQLNKLDIKIKEVLNKNG